MRDAETWIEHNPSFETPEDDWPFQEEWQQQLCSGALPKQYIFKFNWLSLLVGVGKYDASKRGSQVTFCRAAGRRSGWMHGSTMITIIFIYTYLYLYFDMPTVLITKKLWYYGIFHLIQIFDEFLISVWVHLWPESSTRKTQNMIIHTVTRIYMLQLMWKSESSNSEHKLDITHCSPVKWVMRRACQI